MDLKKQIKVVLSYEGSKAQWRNNHGSKEWRSANKVASVVMQQGLLRSKNCGCLEDLFIMLKSLNNNKINQKQQQMENQFKLAEGKMIHLDGTFYTNSNLTDEKAIEIIKRFPSHSKTFSEKPSDWEDVVAGKKAEKKTKTTVVKDAVIKKDAPTREEELLSKEVEERQKRLRSLLT